MADSKICAFHSLDDFGFYKAHEAVSRRVLDSVIFIRSSIERPSSLTGKPCLDGLRIEHWERHISRIQQSQCHHYLSTHSAPFSQSLEHSNAHITILPTHRGNLRNIQVALSISNQFQLCFGSGVSSLQLFFCVIHSSIPRPQTFLPKGFSNTS